MAMELSLSLDGLPEGERLEAWRHAASNSVMPHEIVPEEGVLTGAVLKSRDVGMITTTWLRGGFGAAEMMRTWQHISNSKGDFLIVTLQRSGSTVERQCGEEVVLRPGDISFSLSTSPCHRYRQRGLSELTTLRVPISAIALPGSVLRKIVGLKAVSNQGVGRVLSSFMLTVHDDEVAGATVESLGLVAIELTRAAVADQLEGNLDGRAERHAALRRAITSFIDENFADPDLSPGLIAKEHNISARLLHRVFAETGTTVGAFVRNRRLQIAAQELAKCEFPNRTIDSLAQRCGFSSHAHFTRVFKDAYGKTPREWRRSRS